MLHLQSPSISKMVEYFGEFMEYSLDEKKVGKWVDGKPVYRKTFIFNAPTKINAWEYYFTEEIKALNIKDVVSIVGTAKYGNVYYDLSASAGGGCLTSVNVSPTTGIMVYCQVTLVNSEIRVTFEYTKTTD